jgi:hypothetical protein
MVSVCSSLIVAYGVHSSPPAMRRDQLVRWLQRAVLPSPVIIGPSQSSNAEKRSDCLAIAPIGRLDRVPPGAVGSLPLKASIRIDVSNGRGAEGF